MNEVIQQLSGIRGLILDMDGVLWRDEQPIGNLSEVFTWIARMGLKVVLATNNSTKTVDQYLLKLSRFGIELDGRQIITSSLATANYLKQAYPTGGSVYVIGEDGLVSTLDEQGFTDVAGYLDMEPIAVIVGLDRNLTYHKLRQATRHILQGALFIATNCDNTLPTHEGLIPGAGAVVSAVQTAVGKEPLVIGKPASEMYRWAMELMSVTPTETLVIGDRLETDVAGAQNLGCLTGLVFSGVTTEDQAACWRPAPDILAPDLSTLLEKLWKIRNP